MLYKMAVKKAFTYCTGVLWQLINVCKVHWSWKLLDTMLNINYHDYNIVLKLSRCSHCKLLSLSKQKKSSQHPAEVITFSTDRQTQTHMHSSRRMALLAMLLCIILGTLTRTSMHSTLGSFLTVVTKTACAHKPSGHRISSVRCCKPPATSEEPESSFKECLWLRSPTRGTAATHWWFSICSCRCTGKAANFLEALPGSSNPEQTALCQFYSFIIFSLCDIPVSKKD